jgi:hypothetical protein
MECFPHHELIKNTNQRFILISQMINMESSMRKQNYMNFNYSASLCASIFVILIQVLTEYSNIHYLKTTQRLSVILHILSLGEGNAEYILNGWIQLLPV